MRTEYKKELNRVCLHIDIAGHYEENYQMHMLRENHIPGIIEVDGCGIDGQSRYIYQVTGLTSMKALYEAVPIQKEAIEEFVSCLMQTLEMVKQYMLNPDCLLLYPEFVFFGKEKWHFCYVPARKRPLCKAFHVITEYILQKLDYEETSAIMLAYELHKATLQDNYNLQQIMEEYEEHEKMRNGTRECREELGEEAYTQAPLSDNLFSLEEEVYEPTQDVETIREMGGKWTPWKKVMKHITKGKWGNWQDLIMETDGQEEDTPL